MSSSYIQLIQTSIPKEYSNQLGSLPSSTCGLFDHVLRFALGGDCPEDASSETRTQWKERQSMLEKLKKKRPREDGEERDAKRARTDEPALYSLHNIPVTSPIRKRVHVSIHKSSLSFIHPTSGNVESSISLSSLSRVFLLPTRGKAKPHWTVVLLSPDTQVIFGIDATPPPFETTDEKGTTTKHPKSTPIIPHLRTFLSHLPFPTLEPNLNVFKSALGATSGTEGYRGAKPGTLWFLQEGVLWDTSKTCEFWDMRDIASDGVRTISATGRSCSVILTRKDAEQAVDIQMVDGKEQEPIARWVKAHQHRFGKSDDPGEAPPEDSDEEDEDFVLHSSDDDGGSATSDSDENEDNGRANGDEEEEAEESGEDEDEVEELDPARHPLLRPGAMPKMSRAALEAAIGIVQDEFIGGPVDGSDGEEEGEEDELED